jgi:hypothetical protein
MRISKPVDVAALRREWLAIIDASDQVDHKTRRVARRTCFGNIIKDIDRYDLVTSAGLFFALFEDARLAVAFSNQMAVNGPEATAAWLERQLGVELT